MKNVKNLLNLKDSDGEVEMALAVTAIQNSLTEATTAKDKIAGELETAKAALTTAQNRVKELEDAAKEAEKTANEEKAKTLETAAATLAENFAKAGKIKNSPDSILKVKNQLIKDFEGTKAMFDEVSINRKGADIVDKIEGESEAGKYTMGAVMITIANKTNQLK